MPETNTHQLVEIDMVGLIGWQTYARNKNAQHTRGQIDQDQQILSSVGTACEIQVIPHSMSGTKARCEMLKSYRQTN